MCPFATDAVILCVCVCVVQRTHVKWTNLEDNTLIESITTSRKSGGTIQWVHVAATMVDKGFDRSNVQCRLRWSDVLQPGLRVGKWSHADDAKFVELYIQYGCKWRTIGIALSRSGSTVRVRYANMTKRVDRFMVRQKAADESGPLFKFIHM